MCHTVKPVLGGHSKIDKSKGLTKPLAKVKFIWLKIFHFAEVLATTNSGPELALKYSKHLNNAISCQI